MNLSQEQFAKARAWVKAHARTLDRRLFEYYFEGGPAQAVIRELARYQNPDGGFGGALEPDFRLEQSSPMATTIAFQYLRDVGASSDSPLVRDGIAYFLNTYNQERKGWQSVPLEVNDIPHAPWWSVEANAPMDAAALEKAWPNPSAEIVGYLNEYAALVPPEFLKQANEQAITNLKNQPQEMEPHDLLCYIQMSQKLPEPLKAEAFRQLRQRARQSAPLAAEGYPSPYWFATSPSAPLAELLKAEAEQSLDYQIRQQTEEGYWKPSWAWGQYEDAWAKAEQEWKGYLTVKLLRALQQYGKIEGSA